MRANLLAGHGSVEVPKSRLVRIAQIPGVSSKANLKEKLALVPFAPAMYCTCTHHCYITLMF